MQLLCFALSLAVIQYIDHAGKAHDHGKQNSTAKPAAGKARIHSEPSQRGKNHKDDGSEFAHINTPVSLSTSTYLLLQVYQETTKNPLPGKVHVPAAYNLPRLVLLLRCPEYSGGVEVIP